MNKQVTSIVSTYNLRPNLETKVSAIADRAVDELCITSFDEQYQFIANLIELITSPRRMISLDTAFNIDSRRLIEKIGVDDPSLLALSEEQDEEEFLTMGETLDILKRELDYLSFSCFLQLAKASNNGHTQFRIGPNELIRLAPKIQERLEKIAKEYGGNGKLVIPHRPIVSVKFEPDFQVRFKRRKYKGDPLKFFRDNISTYGGLIRSELNSLDTGLYQTLVKHNQIDLAIPEDRSSLDPSDVEKIITAHKTYKGNLAKTAKKLGFAISTVKGYWEQKGLKARGKCSLSQEGIDKIIAAYETYNGNASETSRQLNRDVATVLKYWKQEGLKVQKTTALSQERIDKIVAAYETYAGNVTEASRELGHAKDTVSKYWKQEGLLSSK